MFVDDSVKRHPVPPAGGKVVDVDVGISAEKEVVRTWTYPNSRKG